MELTAENYFSKEARLEYMGSSQFKGFLKCPEQEMAKINELFTEEKSKALLMGSYIDAYFSEEMDDFRKNTPELFTKQGTLKSEFLECDKIIEFIKKDEKFLKYLSGEHQRIMTGTIAGVKFKIKIDSFFPDKCIVDQKIMKDLEPVWDDKTHTKMNLVEYYGYTIQGAIYQEVVRQNTGKKLPFILAIATKEKVPAKALLRIDDQDLELALHMIEDLAPIFDKMKHQVPLTEEDRAMLAKYDVKEKCGHCDWCKQNMMVTGIFSYHTIDPEERS